MITYGGGTIIDPEAIGHDFLRNFLSDLGKFSSGNMASMIVGFLSIPIFKFLVPNLDTIGIIFEKQQNY
jgi:hypothetical protein